MLENGNIAVRTLNRVWRELSCFMLAIQPRCLNMYDAAMKFFLLAIFVLFAAQPVQASACNMCAGQDTGHSQHDNMHDGPMDDDAQNTDCCDHDSDDPDDGCDSMSHCGACATALVAISPSVLNPAFIPNLQQHLPVTNEILSRSGSPPFRPPIS